MDGETQTELNGWGNTKEIKWMGKHKWNRMDGETQTKLNGWGNKGDRMEKETQREHIYLMGKHRRNRMDGETQWELKEWRNSKREEKEWGTQRE